MSSNESPFWLVPQWPAPSQVRAVSTLRFGGASVGDFDNFNLAMHVGDDPDAVLGNRRRLREALGLQREPAWLNQVHGVTVIEAKEFAAPPSADASFSREAGQACVVMTADCLPVLLCDRAGTRVAAAHAGWRGLVNGVLKATVDALDVRPSELLAWMGPAIEQDAFEVGDEVREQFIARDPQDHVAFVANDRGRWQADLYELARRELKRLGLSEIHGGGYRCFSDSERFFSYRRSARTGRMATMVWIER